MTPEDVAKLETVLNNHTAQIAELKDLLRNNQATVQGLAQVHNDILALTQAIRSFSSTAATTSDPVRPKPSLPNPDKFSGQQYTWENWEASIKAKIRIDGPAIGGPEAQFYYVYDRLEGKIQSLVMPQLVQAEETKIYNVDDLFKQLSRLYDDPNKVREAEDALHGLRQESDPLGTHLAKFERLLYKSKANLWSDSAKIALLRKSLNNHYKQRLDTQLLLPEDYEGFVTMLQKLGKMKVHGGGAMTHTKTGGEAMDIGAIETGSVPSRPAKSTRGLLNMPDDEFEAYQAGR